MRIDILVCCLALLSSCTGARRSTRYFQKELRPELEHSAVFSKGFTGFHLLDAATGRELCAWNADRPFTPASNTKILTLATCLAVLGDSLPGLEITGVHLGGDEIRGGTEWIEAYFVAGTGDPTFLHPKFSAWQSVFEFIKNHGTIWYAKPGNDKIPRFGPGWSWDDYSDDYSAERSSFPVYGNVITVRKSQEARRNGTTWETFPKWETFPGVFEDSLKRLEAWEKIQPGVRRREFENTIEYQTPEGELEVEVPVFQAEKYKLKLLGDTLHREFSELNISDRPPARRRFIYSVPVDTVYRRMMHQSDNFIAEQLLLLSAGVKFDTMDQGKMIAWAVDSLFGGFADQPRWVDGSGLSRYNLMSPRFLSSVLFRLYRTQPRERLFSFFPAGGVSGTISDWYAGSDGKPFVFAKTGGMSGVHCLSGYLVARSGKVLIFSFMHNNFIGSNKPWKQEMQRFLLEIRDRN